jgi:hypothetical protein
MNLTEIQCPAGYTCDIDIYPMWWDVALLGIIVLLIVVLLFVLWRLSR